MWISGSNTVASAAPICLKETSETWVAISLHLLKFGLASVGGGQALRQGVPRQGRALDPHRELAHSLQGLERFELLGKRLERSLREHHALERLHELARLGHRPALEGFGHHRGRRLADDAA